MKVVCVCLALATSAFAFAPSQEVVRSKSLALNAAHLSTPAPFKDVGKVEWELLTTKWGSEDTGTFLQAAELKHGRSAMLATFGFAYEKLGITFDKFTPHEYLSVTQNVKFSDLAAMSPVDAIKAVPAEGLAQIFCAIAAVEIYELTHAGGEIKYGERVAPGLQQGGLTGDIGWNPLSFKVSDKLRLQEIQNGRAAMMAITAWVCHDVIPGSVPIPLLWS